MSTGMALGRHAVFAAISMRVAQHTMSPNR